MVTSYLQTLNRKKQLPHQNTKGHEPTETTTHVGMTTETIHENLNKDNNNVYESISQIAIQWSTKWIDLFSDVY